MVKIISVITILLSLVSFWFWNTARTINTINAPLPENFPSNSFSHQSFENLLKKFVDSEGNIDYQAWSESDKALLHLQQYLAAVAKFSPENAIKRFASKQDELAYWIYSYNALVIHTILMHWPLDSVTDLQAPLEVIKGLGFFYKQSFIVGEKSYNLYQLEHEKMIRANSDPRLHFLLNCGSASCPPMRPELPIGVAFEPFLQEATVNFINDENNVYINKDKKKIELSAIFKWYRDDFERYATENLTANRFLKQKNKISNAALLAFLDHFAKHSLQKKLQSAQLYSIKTKRYDWQLNKSAQNKIK